MKASSLQVIISPRSFGRELGGMEPLEFYMRELTDGTATLMTYDDLYLFTFPDMESARQACKDWYRVHALEVGEYSSMGDDHVSCSVCS